MRGIRLLILSDTHVPKRAKDLPGELWERVDAADVVVHAGDRVDVGLLDELEARSRRLIAVWGNNDDPELRGHPPDCACSTPARRPTVAANRTAPT